MKKEDAEEFTQSLGQIVGGSWKQISLAKRLGVPKALGLGVDEWVNTRLGGYIKMNIEERRQVVEELTAEGASTREIAEVLGTSHMTVARDLGVTNVTDSTVEDAETVTNVPLDAVAILTASDKVKADVIAKLHTGDEESYTPTEYLESARKVMGTIDLDPASNEMAQANVNAGIYYTIEDDGLTKEWEGKVFMNPPYTARVINLFIDKLVGHFEANEVTEAIVLTNNNTDTIWFHQAAKTAAAVCFTAGRVNFLKRDGTKSSPTNGQAFLYFGPNVKAFKAKFSKHGLVMVKA